MSISAAADEGTVPGIAACSPICNICLVRRCLRAAAPEATPHYPRMIRQARARSGEIRRSERAGHYARLAVSGLRKGQLTALRWRDACGRWAARALRGRRPLRPTGQRRCRMARAAAAVLVALASVIAATSCSSPARPGQQSHVRLAARIRLPGPKTSVLAGAADVVAGDLAHDLFASAPVVIAANMDRSAELAAAARSALRAHAPLLLASAGGAVVSAGLRGQIKALDPRAVLAVGVAPNVLAAALPGIRVVADPAMLPATKTPPPLGRLALLVRPGDRDTATLAAITTAQVAGARVIAVRGGDPRTDPAAIAALSADRPRRVIAIGAGFGPARQLASRVADAQTGVQLPGGGQVLFPGRLLVALYGHPGAPALGALGQQDLSASIARARKVAAAYRTRRRVPVIPALEIIATVAEAHAGPDGDYSYQSSVAFLRPWVRRATVAGMYVILDLQPGRASLLAQAKSYRSLLELPDVGLALDPEWKLGPGQLPLHQIGSVSTSEVNTVIRWLAGLTAQHRLPQKLLVLHQFRLSMISDEHALDTRYQDLAILIHMDGQGTPADKQQTWEAITGAAPAGVFFGWKDFYAKDHPMISPQQTIARTPRLSMISYQLGAADH